MRLFAFAVSLLAFPVLAATAGAQSPYGTTYEWDDVHRVGWSNQLVLGLETAFGRTLDADPNGDGERDVFVRADGHVVCVFAPTTYGSMHESSIAVPALDFAVVDDVGRDLLLVVDGTALRRFDHDPATGGFVELPLPGITATDWSDVIFLRAFDEPAEGCSYVVGVRDDRRTVLVARYTWSSGFSPRPGFTLPSTAIDLVFPRWDTLGGRDLAFLCADGLRVLDREGFALEPLYPCWHPGGVVETLEREDLSGRDLVAWITEAPAQANWLLYTLGEDEVDGPVTLALPVEHGGAPARVEPISLCAGDVDGDEDDDLALALHDSDFDYLLVSAAQQNGGAPRFDAAPGNHLKIEVAAGGAATTPLDRGRGRLVDCYGDGALRYVRPYDVTEGLLVLPTLPFPSGFTPATLPVVGAHDVFAAPVYSIPSSAGAGDLEVRLWVPDELDFEATHVRAVLWKQAPASGGPRPYVESPSEQHAPFRVALAGGALEDDQALVLTIPEAGTFDGDRYFVEVRFQRKDPQGELLRSSAAWTAVLSVEATTAQVQAELADLILDGAPHWLTVTLPNPGTTLVGAFGPLIRIPEFEEDTPPRLSPPLPEAQATTWDQS